MESSTPAETSNDVKMASPLNDTEPLSHVIVVSPVADAQRVSNVNQLFVSPSSKNPEKLHDAERLPGITVLFPNELLDVTSISSISKEIEHSLCNVKATFAPSETASVFIVRSVPFNTGIIQSFFRFGVSALKMARIYPNALSSALVGVIETTTSAKMSNAENSAKKLFDKNSHMAEK